MKTVVVYFSLEGHTHYVAEELAHYLGAETLRLETIKPYPEGKFAKMFLGGMSALLKQSPKLRDYTFNEEQYDCIIIGTPVWASTYVPAIRTFIKAHNLKGKKLAFYACSGGGNASKCLAHLMSEMGKPIAELSLIDPNENMPKEQQTSLEAFCKQIKEHICD